MSGPTVFSQNRICQMLRIRYPILLGGMAHVSRAPLVAAVSNAGGLGIIGSGGMPPDILVEQIAQIYDNYGFATEIIVSSVRHPQHVVEAALIGADICTIPFAILEKMFNHCLTDVGVERFLADWEKAGLTL